MDWKVQIFLFVVIAAVGVDYNIFLASRLAEEARRYSPREAVARAVEHTGPVISSCGIIMAATLGSLVVGDIVLLQQLGTAFAIGMIIDTFVTRPLLLPAFAARFKRTGKARLLG
jgi:RND superfamily putative drug exporter